MLSSAVFAFFLVANQPSPTEQIAAVPQRAKTESEIRSELNKSYQCKRSSTGRETCAISYNGTIFEVNKVSLPLVEKARLVALGPGHVIMIHRDCFELLTAPGVTLFITESLEVALFGEETNKKCGN